MSPDAPTSTASPRAFTLATIALGAVFASAGAPVPLYQLLRTEDRIANADLAAATVIYLAVTALTLLTLGRLSDHLARTNVETEVLERTYHHRRGLSKPSLLGYPRPKGRGR